MLFRSPIYSVVVFGREAVLKVVEGMPENCIVCTQVGVRKRMEELVRKTILSEAKIEELCSVVGRSLVNPDGIVRAEHVTEVEAIAKRK